MAIDEAGEKRRVSEVERGRLRRERQARSDVADARSLDDHHAVGDHPIRPAVEDAGRFEDHDGREGGSRRHGRGGLFRRGGAVRNRRRVRRGILERENRDRGAQGRCREQDRFHADPFLRRAA